MIIVLFYLIIGFIYFCNKYLYGIYVFSELGIVLERFGSCFKGVYY